MKKHYEWQLGSAPPVLGEHSAAKHDIYEKYVGIYIERLTRTPSQTVLNLTLVDGFCGGGVYQRGSTETDGSPLRLLRAVDASDRALNAARTKGFHVKADFFFVDDNEDHVAHLQSVLRNRGYGARLGRDIFILHSSFEDACPGIVAHIKKKGRAQRSLFFLDQYGWSAVRFETVRRILSELQNPEVLLTFAVDALIDYLSEKTSVASALLNVELTREDVRALTEMRNGEGWRYLIQNGLYGHVQNRTGARFYTPFFIYSTEAHRAYWLLHLSNHRQARDEMGKLHWQLNNRFQHLGGAGFHALGFDPSRDLRQELLPFMFDDDALRRSEATVMEQLPRLLHSAARETGGVIVEDLFVDKCNDTPITSKILESQLLALRDEQELVILTKDGALKPRSRAVDWTDKIVLPSERSLFTRLGW